MNRLPIVVVPIVVMLLAGCGTGDPVPTNSPVSSSPAATPQPTQTIAPSQPAVDELVLGAGTLGPLVIGQAPVVVDPTLDVISYEPDVCQWAVDEGAIDDPAKWVANYRPANEGRDPSPFGVAVDGGVLVAVAVYDHSISTDRGVHLGSTAAEVQSAYPGELELVTEYEGGDTHLYKLAGATGDLYIDVLRAESVAGYPELGGEVVVRLNLATKAGPPPGFNSDYGLGRCISA